MIEDNKLIKVTNRDNGTVGYTIPDLNNLYRSFNSGESKMISMEELRKLSWIPGGKTIIADYLLIEDKEAIAELLTDVEPEYSYTAEDVKTLLLTGTLDQLKDCLDFAPEGVISLVKKYAVELEINDVAKRQAILDGVGFDVTKAIEINKDSKMDEENDEGKVRRSAPISGTSTTTSTGRRTQPVEYKVVNK